jgi:hypothetical protein
MPELNKKDSRSVSLAFIELSTSIFLGFYLYLPLYKKHSKQIKEKHWSGNKPHSDSTTIWGYDRTKYNENDYYISQVIPPELRLNYIE